MPGITYRKLKPGVYVVSNLAGCKSATTAHYGRDLKLGEGPWQQGTPLQYPAILHFLGDPDTGDSPVVWWEPKDSYVQCLKQQLKAPTLLDNIQSICQMLRYVDLDNSPMEDQ